MRLKADVPYMGHNTPLSAIASGGSLSDLETQRWRQGST
eukprot:CAMPEP_0206149888 /NCGR_PEP_ID=MMETSP1473-20131121/38017_1 /ASSEMBLY_ACC=CAM_ASM_001109 /TAXON_ID=1461547 /ORGANISM="Stichococcus sp, Strain RCC1054" /LENGTH=38 /DNA_ID= /DNA_START= /DNA_END= /DNA_ORIENTATION=